MEEVILDVQIRKEVGSISVKDVRRNGFVPAIVYGGKREATAIKVNRLNYEKIMRQHRGESIVFHLNVFEGEKKLRDYSSIVKEEQKDAVSEELCHIDFKRISLEEEIEVKVGLILVGESVGVKQYGGVLGHILKELDIVCLPMDIPKHIDVDVTELHIGDGVYVKDINLPNNVKTKHDVEVLVASVVDPMREEEFESTDQEPEVIGEKDRQDRKEAKGGQKSAKEVENDVKTESK